MREEHIKEWLSLSETGHVAEAENYYYNTLFLDVIEEFCERNKHPKVKCNVLFSILGFSPEPIILTQRALNPEVHVIFTSDIKDEIASKKIREYLSKYLTSDFKIIELKDGSFDEIYNSLKNQVVLHPSQDYVIDITGGKKSMVASASIFGRDYNCNIVYVDYDKYINQIRKPLPGSESLNYVYTPSINLPEIQFFIQNNPKESDDKVEVRNDLAGAIRKSSNDKTSMTEKFNLAFANLMGQNLSSHESWLPCGILLTINSERSIVFQHEVSGLNITLQRAQLRHFFNSCRDKKASPRSFITDKSQKAHQLNPAIFALMNALNMEIYKQNFK